MKVEIYKEECQRCGKEKELIPDMVICRECNQEIIEKCWGKQYHSTEVAKKLDDLEERVKMLEAKKWSCGK